MSSFFQPWRATCAGLLLICMALQPGCREPEHDANLPEVDLAKTTDLFASPGTTVLRPMDPDTVVAIINGQPLHHRDLATEIALIKNRMREQVPPEQMLALHNQTVEWAMDAVVVKTLLRTAIDEETAAPSEEQIEAVLRDIASRLPAGLSMERFLEMNNSNLSLLKQNIALDVRLKALLESKVASVPPPTETEARTFYTQNASLFDLPERVTARHILLSVTNGMTEAQISAKRNQAAWIQRQLKEGADFDEMARRDSEGPSRTKGGDLGTFRRGQMAEAFDTAAFRQEPNEIGEVLETEYGFHIIQVRRHEEARRVGFEEAREEILTRLTVEKRKQAIQDYIDTLKKNATVEFPE